MKLRKLTVINFRGIGYAEIDFDNFTTLIGPNNIGKSTILHAIHLVLDNKKPRIEDWPGQKASDEKMEIICEFSDLEPWEKTKPAISQLLFNNKLLVKLTAEWNSEKTEFSHDYSVHHKKKQFPFTGKTFTAAKSDDSCKKILSALSIKKAGDYN